MDRCIYYKHSIKKSGEEVWRCKDYKEYKCPANVNVENGSITSLSNKHNHPGDQALINSLIAKESMKKKAKETENKTKNIIIAEVKNLNEAEMAKLPRINSLSLV